MSSTPVAPQEDELNNSINRTDTDPAEGGAAEAETETGVDEDVTPSSPPAEEEDAAAPSTTAEVDDVDVEAILAGEEQESSTRVEAGVDGVTGDEKADGTTRTTKTTTNPPAVIAEEKREVETDDAAAVIIQPPMDDNIDEADADAYGYLRYRFAECMMRCGAKGGGVALLNMKPKRDRAVQILSNELVFRLLRDRQGGARGKSEDKGEKKAADDDEGGRRGRHLKLICDLLIERGATIARPVGADPSFDTVGALADDLVDLALSVDEQRAAMAVSEKSDDTAVAVVEAKDDDAEEDPPAETDASRDEGAGDASETGKGNDGVKTTICRVEGCEKATVLGSRGFLCTLHLAANRPTEPMDPQEEPPTKSQQSQECSVEWCHGKASRRHRGMCAKHGREFVRSSSAKKKPSKSSVDAAEADKSKPPSKSRAKSRAKPKPKPKPKPASKTKSTSKSKSKPSNAKGSTRKKNPPAAAGRAKPGGTTACSRRKPSAKSIAIMERENKTKEACERFGVKYVDPPRRGVETDAHRRVRIDTMISACHAAWEAEKEKKADEAERLRKKDETRELFTAAAAEAARAQARLDGDGDDGDEAKEKKKKRPRVRDPSLPPAKKVVDPFTLKTRYICGVEGCVKYSVRDGVCISHGAHRKTECKIPGCTRYMVSQGVCIGHGAKRKTTCKIEGCTKYRVSNGVCIAHGGKRKTECRVPGCTKYMVSKGVCIAHGGKRKTECKVEGCTKYRVSNGVCISHGGKRKLLCTMEGCSRVRVSDSMCAEHSGGKSKSPPRKRKPKDASAGIIASPTKTDKAPELSSASPTDANVDMMEMPDEINV